MSFTFRDRLKGRRTLPDTPLYPSLQPQFNRHAHLPVVPPRDRYRAPHQKAIYDAVADECTDGLEQPLDSFGESPEEGTTKAIH